MVRFACKEEWPCVACGKPLKTSGRETFDRGTPPSGGTIFEAYGNYGSTTFDPRPWEPETALVVLCDECWRAKDDAVWVYEEPKRPEMIGEVGVRYRRYHEVWDFDNVYHDDGRDRLNGVELGSGVLIDLLWPCGKITRAETVAEVGFLSDDGSVNPGVPRIRPAVKVDKVPEYAAGTTVVLAGSWVKVRVVTPDTPDPAEFQKGEDDDA